MDNFLGRLHKIINFICFVHPIFRFWFFVTFDDEVPKILRNLCSHFQARWTRQKKPERSDQNTKNQKTKIWEEPNNYYILEIKN